MYNGMTGKMMKVKIFICPTYYQRLKHMVNDKKHARSKGPRVNLTRQAPEGEKSTYCPSLIKNQASLNVHRRHVQIAGTTSIKLLKLINKLIIKLIKKLKDNYNKYKQSTQYKYIDHYARNLEICSY
jgi:hypothetical protein